MNLVDPWGLCGERTRAPFEWWDITSWILLETRYGGITKSGPGEPVSNLDRAFKKHDELLKETGTRFWDLGNRGVRKAHKELLRDWKDYINEKNKEQWENFNQKAIEILTNPHLYRDPLGIDIRNEIIEYFYRDQGR